jgi:ubiquinone/menaquinone biosynthesis C-methylase UbiE
VFDHAGAYDQFMGRYSSLLGGQMADLASVRSGQRVLDVGCGPGALTSELVTRVGPASVAAVDPSEPFVTAVRERHPGVDARVARAEALPFDDGTFDAALAQLVVHFMRDPVAGLSEMRRVTRRGGMVVACVWDNAGQGPLTPFWRAASEIDPQVDAELDRAGVREGHLAELFRAAGLRGIASTTVSARLAHATFESYWRPFELGVGPAGVFVAGLDAERRDQLREGVRRHLPEAPFTHTVRAWAVVGVA